MCGGRASRCRPAAPRSKTRGSSRSIAHVLAARTAGAVRPRTRRSTSRRRVRLGDAEEQRVLELGYQRASGNPAITPSCTSASQRPRGARTTNSLKKGPAKRRTTHPSRGVAPRGPRDSERRHRAQTLAPEQREMDRDGEGAESLIRADVRRRPLPPDVLLRARQGQDETPPPGARRPSRRRYAPAAAHVALVCREEPHARPAVADGQAEALCLGDGTSAPQAPGGRTSGTRVLGVRSR